MSCSRTQTRNSSETPDTHEHIPLPDLSALPPTDATPDASHGLTGSMDSAGNVENWNIFNRDRDYNVYEYRYFTVSEILLSLNSLKAKKNKKQQKTKQKPKPKQKNPHTILLHLLVIQIESLLFFQEIEFYS